MTTGFIGTGNMGLPMAGKLLDAGHALVVYDTRAQAMAPLLARQAREASSVREIGDQAETVFVSLPTLEALREVCLGADGLLGGSAIKTLVNTCTVGVPLVEEIAAQAATLGITLIDCPISGGPPGARAGTLSVMVSGDPASIDGVMAMIEQWGPVTIAGDKPGLAQVLKLTNNILSAVALIATSEAYVMGAKGGLDPEIMTQAINAGSGRNSATMEKFPRAVLPRSFDFGAPMHILMKDIDLAVQQGERLGIPMWVCQAARLVFRNAIDADGEHADITSLVTHVERAAKFEMPKTR
ncbi:MAG: 3-hydroxyisobutyrate dehydrogenase-like beta-hydroxyacid dehydrogenase [Gammaproteobacteria bacterium]|jgi:3-hydroxyisobutyrate dehydrogenase-like beta-hydroxyacid dehydrogenase